MAAVQLTLSHSVAVPADAAAAGWLVGALSPAPGDRLWRLTNSTTNALSPDQRFARDTDSIFIIRHQHTLSLLFYLYISLIHSTRTGPFHSLQSIPMGHRNRERDTHTAE